MRTDPPNGSAPPEPIVSDLMHADVVTCRPDDTLNRCAQIMWDEACGCVPVVDEVGRPISIITDRDVCMAAYIQGKPLSDIVVSSAMSKRLLLVGAHDSVAVAERVMRRHGVRRLLVVGHDDALVGVLSFDDIVRDADFRPWEDPDPLSAPVLAETAAAMSHRARH